MFFDLVNVSITFQIYINKVLINLINIIYVVYLNDILIYSAELTNYWRYIKQIFERLRQFQLYVNFVTTVLYSALALWPTQPYWV